MRNLFQQKKLKLIRTLHWWLLGETGLLGMMRYSKASFNQIFNVHQISGFFVEA